MNEKIVKFIAQKVKEGCSNSYIEACAWSMRTSDTSMNDITNTISIFRLYFKQETEE